MLDGNRFPQPAFFLSKFTDTSISDAVSPADHLAYHLARQVFAAVGTDSRARDALGYCILIFDAVLAIGALDKFA